jgi:hypothetical protein
MPFHQVVMGSTKGPEWPSPHDCTSSVLDELVLIQLLNLVQSQRLSHTFFLGPPTLSRDFFFHLRTSPAHPTTLFKKQIPTYPTPLLMLWIYFFKALFHFVVIVNAATMYSPLVIADVQRRTRNCHNFKVWATRGAIFSRRHQNKICFLQFFLHLWFLYIFNLGLSLWDLLF